MLQGMHFEGMFALSHIVANAALKLGFHAALEPLVVVEGRRVFVALAAFAALESQQIILHVCTWKHEH